MLDNDNGTENNNTEKQIRTNVRDNEENVSRETLNKPDNPGVKKLYAEYRKNGLSRTDSFYNALYLRCCDKYYSSDVAVRTKYANVYKHPLTWFGNATTMWKHNKWSVAIKLLEVPPKLKHGFGKVFKGFGKVGMSLVKGAEGSGGSIGRSVGMLFAAAFLCGTVVVGGLWWRDAAKNSKELPALQMYIDGEFVGNVRSVEEVNKAKDKVESSISVGLGMPYALDCSITYEAVRGKEFLVLNEAGLGQVLHEKAHDGMKTGYCLYKGDLPVCAVEDKQLLEECIQESIRYKFPELVDDENVRNVGYKDFVILHGSYPAKLFVDENELRLLLSLPLSDDSADGAQSASGLQVGNTLMTDGHSVGTSSDVANSEGNMDSFSVSIEAVVTKTETVDEVIPFETEYVYDDMLPEGLTAPISAGRNGFRTATYSVDYTDGKETARRLLSEEMVTEPVNAVRKLGTRPLTEEERQYKSTGTYIYPSRGGITSTYGWRVLGGSNEFHKGLDMMSDKGLDLIASDGGVVIQASDKNNGYGLCILIEHDDGTITRYAHCEEVYVAETQRVKQGQLIAKMGATGYVTGVHVHFEIIKNGMTVDPMEYLIPR